MAALFKSLALRNSMGSRLFSTNQSSGAKVTGLVKWFDSTKGYGFVIPDAASGIPGDIFVHQSNIVSATGFRTLEDGLRVSFECRKDKIGKNQAYEVTLEDGSPVKIESKLSTRTRM